MNSKWAKGSSGPAGDETQNMVAQNGVRRLTPRECERLQALPDDWTNHGPDGRRYAALGDAVTSSVAEWIGRRIIAA
jgi:DNA (cytosine-5)-methyltransferase 1